MIGVKLVRLHSLVATSVILAGLTPLALSTSAQAQALPAPYSGSAHADLLGTDITLPAASVAGLRTGHALSTVDSTSGPASVAESANLHAAIAGFPIPVDTQTATAPPPSDPAEDTLAPVAADPLISLGAVTRDTRADFGSAISCPSTQPTQVLSDAVTTLAATSVASLPALLPTVAQVGVSTVHTTTELVENSGNLGHWDIESRVTTELGDVSLLGGAAVVDVTSPVTTFAHSDGTTGTSGYVNPPTVHVTTGLPAPLDDIAIPLNGTPVNIPITVPGVNLISVNVTAFTPTTTNSGATGEADLEALVKVDVLLGTLAPGDIAQVHLALAPQHVTAVAPAGGVECAAIAAVPVITAPADGSSTSDQTPVITGTATYGSASDPGTITVRDGGGNIICTATVQPDGTWSCTPASDLPPGTYTITATETSGTATSPASAPVTFIVDILAPNAPVIQTPADGSSTNDTTPLITGTAEADSDVTVYDTDGTTELCTTTADGSGNWSCTSTGLAEGSHTITATATDAAGNTSPASAPNTFTVDTVAPAAPVIQTPANGSTTNDNTPLITGTAEADSDVTVYDTDGTTELCTTTADGSGNWSCVSSVLLDGSHTITATSTDDAGNVSPASAPNTFTVDTVLPSAPVIQSPADGSSTFDTTPTISGTAEAGSDVTVFDTDGTTVLCITTADGSGNWSCISSTLGEGPHTITATATDGADNVSPASAPVTFTVDTTAPAAPVITGPADGATVGDTTPAISGTGEPNATVTVREGGNFLCAAVVNPNGSWSCSPAIALPDGDHTVTATQTDPAGNTSPASTPVTFTVDSDLDDDGLTNIQENQLGTDPNDPDTDNDGLTDGQEVNGFSVGVCGRAATTFRTNPLNADTDSDGLGDGREKTGSLNTKYGSRPTNPKVADTDGEGLKDGVEVKGVYIGIRVTTGKGASLLGKVRTNPCRADTDGDGLSDRREKVGTKVNQKVIMPKGKVMYLRLLKSNPTTKDTDRDGLRDKPEVTGSMNTEFNRHKSDPAYWDTDRGGVSDGVEIKAGSDPTNVFSTPNDPRMTRITQLG